MPTVKSQDTVDTLRDLVAAAPPTPRSCALHNGVEDERAAVRCFGRVHGVAVMCPTAFLEPVTSPPTQPRRRTSSTSVTTPMVWTT